MLDRLPTFKPRQFANAVFAIGKLNLYNAELVDALLAVRYARVLGARARERRALACTACVWCSYAPRQPPSPQHASPPGARPGHTRTRTQAMVPQLSRFRAAEFARLLDGLQQLNVAVPQDLLDAFFQADTARAIVGSAAWVRRAVWLLRVGGESCTHAAARRCVLVATAPLAPACAPRPQPLTPWPSPAPIVTPILAPQARDSSDRAQQDKLGVILSLCQRLGLAPPQEWLDIMAAAVLDKLSSNAAQLTAADVSKMIVGLAGLGFKPSPEQWNTLVAASMAQLPTGYMRAQSLAELAWGFSQFGSPMPQEWASAFNYELYGQSRCACACRGRVCARLRGAGGGGVGACARLPGRTVVCRAPPPPPGHLLPDACTPASPPPPPPHTCTQVPVCV
jgi:hypothetical protein